jgi:hypothetical protein
MFKYFTTADGTSVAVNPLHVMSITEYQLGKQYPKWVILNLTNGDKITIIDNYLEVVATLSLT